MHEVSIFSVTSSKCLCVRININVYENKHKWIIDSFITSKKLLFAVNKILEMSSLTSEQEAFLEECNLEFSERYTTSDPEFKIMYESDIPRPPIIFPWYGRSRFNSNRDRDRGGYYDNRSSSNRDGGDRSSGRYNNRHSNDDRRDRSEGTSSHNKDKRFRPY